MEKPQAYVSPEQKKFPIRSKYLPRIERYDHQKIDRKFQVMRGQNKCANNDEYPI